MYIVLYIAVFMFNILVKGGRLDTYNTSVLFLFCVFLWCVKIISKYVYNNVYNMF